MTTGASTNCPGQWWKEFLSLKPISRYLKQMTFRFYAGHLKLILLPLLSWFRVNISNKHFSPHWLRFMHKWERFEKYSKYNVQCHGYWTVAWWSMYELLKLLITSAKWPHDKNETQNISKNAHKFFGTDSFLNEMQLHILVLQTQ